MYQQAIFREANGLRVALIILAALVAHRFVSPDNLSTATQLALGMLGAVVSVANDWTQRHRTSVLLSFFALTVVGSIASNKSAEQNAAMVAKAQENLNQSLKETNELSKKGVELQQKTAELQQLNTQLQQQLIEQNKTVERLARIGISTATGGDSYAYVSVEVNLGLLVLTHQGRYPLSDISIRITDLERADISDIWGKTKTVPMLAPGSSATIGSVGDRTSFRSNIFYFSRNGSWSQALRARKVEGRWVSAYRVNRHTADGKGEVLLKSGDQHFLDEPLPWP